MSSPQRLPSDVPPRQRVSSATFKQPPLDGSLTLPELCDWHGQHSPEHTFFVYAEDDGTIKNIKWSEASQAIRRGAALIRGRLGWRKGTDETPVIAIVSSSDSIPYMTMILGIMRANYAAFPISTRNSPAAIAHLIEKTRATHILVGREQAMHDLVMQSLEVLKTQHVAARVPELSPMPIFDELYASGEDLSMEEVPYEQRGPDTLALILHSSGSTSFPKPINGTLHRLLQFARAPCYGERDLAGKIMSLHGNPMFHALGFTIASFAITAGMCVSLPAPKNPPPSSTAELTIHGAMNTRSDLVLAVPSLIESWSRNTKYVEWLSQCNGLIFGGGPLTKEVGDYLVSHGVPLILEYGSTECGAVNHFLQDEHLGDDWQYFRFADHIDVRLEPYVTGQYECIIMANEHVRPHVINTTIDGIDGYATSDVLEQHPTRNGYWRVLGRTDDQIIHSTGEKTNPGPLEGTMNQDPHVVASVIFGSGRFQAGILVEPRAEYSIDPADENRLAEFRNQLWPTVQKINAFAPQHSRLFKEMILVTKPSKPFAYTAKHTVRRGIVLKEYEEEINALYDTIDSTTEVNVQYPAQWHPAQATSFVRSVVHDIMGLKVSDDDDVFQNGCDSLQATYIRNALLRAIRESSKINTHTVSEGFVYDNPTVSRLGSFLTSVVLGAKFPSSNPESSIARIASMHAMVAKYTTDFPVFSPDRTASGQLSGDVVLVTGTTGSLGCHLLVQLASNSEVRRVYALNRPARNGDTTRHRQERALLERGMDVAILDSDRVVMLEGDLTQPGFGLPADTYHEMHTSVTHIIHNAWHVDFALKLSSFEPQVQGIRALVDFALTVPASTKPAHIQFISSIGVVQNMPPAELCMEESVDPSNVVSTGYAESKWVSEQILYTAAVRTPLPALVVRLGQVCGGPDGVWNSHEWFPSMVQSAPVVQCFPDDTRAVDWIPADLAAAAIVDFREASSPTNTVHLVHPRPVSWRSLATFIAGTFSVPLVSYSEWFAKLESLTSEYNSRFAVASSGNDSPRGLHASRLLSFFRSIAENFDAGPVALGMVSLDLKYSLSASSTLSNPELRRLHTEDMQKWLSYWRKAGVFS